MSTPVAMIPYANMAPYREAGCPRGCAFVPLVPSASVRALQTGRVVAAAVPVGALPVLGDLVEPLGRFGIAARESSMSVLLFSDRPFEDLDRDTPLRLTDESTSSVRLLRVLLDRNPESTGTGRVATGNQLPTGELIIGDRALSTLYDREKGRFSEPASTRLSSFSHVTDLASRWFALTGLPFVFARWVVRCDAPEGCKAAIAEWLDRFRRQETRWVRSAIPETAKRTGLPADLVARYFKVIRRTLTEADLAGQTRFLEALKRCGNRTDHHSAMPAATAA